MQIGTKLRKFAGPDGWYSAQAALARWSYRLPVQPFLDAVDRKGFAKIHERHTRSGKSFNQEKYLDLEGWMKVNVKRVRNQRIRAAPPRLRVLDIGSGAGYFLHIMRCLGHDALGLDIDAQQIFRETFAEFGLARVIHRITAFERLPDLGEPFDIVTGHLTCFNRHEGGADWGAAEWDFFLRDVETHLKAGGRMQFELNVRRDGRHMGADLRDSFRALGGRVDRRKVCFAAALPRATVR